MKRTVIFALVLLMLPVVSGCAPLIIGSAVGVLGGYAVSRDTIEGETDLEYEQLWDAAVTVARIRGTIKSQDHTKGYIYAHIESSKVWINLYSLTKATTRVKVRSRNKFHFPNLKLAQDIFVKVIDEAK